MYIGALADQVDWSSSSIDINDTNNNDGGCNDSNANDNNDNNINDNNTIDNNTNNNSNDNGNDNANDNSYDYDYNYNDYSNDSSKKEENYKPKNDSNYNKPLINYNKNYKKNNFSVPKKSNYIPSYKNKNNINNISPTYNNIFPLVNNNKPLFNFNSNNYNNNNHNLNKMNKIPSFSYIFSCIKKIYEPSQYNNNPYNNNFFKKQYGHGNMFGNPPKKKSNFIENSDIDNYKTIKLKIFQLKNKIKRDKLYINLIFFDEKMTNYENKQLYSVLQLNVVGGFYGFQDINVFIKSLYKFEQKNLPFILLCSGSSFQKIIKICIEMDFINSIIIYCYDKNKYLSLYNNINKLKLISNNLQEIINFLKTYKFSSYDIDMKNQIDCSPLISFYEYERCYFVFHEALSYFFEDNLSLPKFPQKYMEEVYSFIEKDNEYDYNLKNKLKNILKKLSESNDLASDFLKEYTYENGFVYFFNKIMRRIENGIIQLSFFVGPMFYSLVRYILINPTKGLTQNTILYRSIIINEIDLNMYYMAVGNIIVFPAFTSTSLKTGFSPTNQALKLNKIDKEKIAIEMIMNYRHLNGNISPGIIIGDLSYYQNEKEVLLFPFTFIKILNIVKVDENHYKLNCDIINRKSILEFGLKNGKKIIVNNNNNEITLY